MFILGSGDQGLAVLSIYEGEVEGLVDIFEEGRFIGCKILDKTVLGGLKWFESLLLTLDRKPRAIVAFGDNFKREEIFCSYKNKVEYINVICNSARIFKHSFLGKGNFIGTNVTIQALVEIGDNNIINSGSIVSCNCKIGNKDKMTIGGVLNDLKIGFKYIYSHKTIFMIIILSAFVNFFLAAYNLLLPYSNQMFGEISDGLYGVFLTAEAIGGFIGAILSGVINKTLSSKRLMVFLSCSGLMLMLSTPLYFLFQNFIILAFSPALFSLFISIFNIQFFSIVQREVDTEFLGRVFGIIFTVAILFMPVGSGFFSVVLNPNNTFNLFIIGVSITILSLIFSTLLKRYDKNS